MTVLAISNLRLERPERPERPPQAFGRAYDTGLELVAIVNL